MKKLLSIIAIALLIIPLKANATITLSGAESESDTNGVITAAIYLNIETGEMITEKQSISINAKHAKILSIEGFGSWTKDELTSILASDGSQATLVLSYGENNGVYEGKGETVQVGVVKYEHDQSYTGSEKCEVSLGLNDAITYIEEKTTPNAKTGSVLPYAGIVAGISLIAAAYVISRKTNKLYKI